MLESRLGRFGVSRCRTTQRLVFDFHSQPARPARRQLVTEDCIAGDSPCPNRSRRSPLKYTSELLQSLVENGCNENHRQLVSEKAATCRHHQHQRLGGLGISDGPAGHFVEPCLCFAGIETEPLCRDFGVIQDRHLEPNLTSAGRLSNDDSRYLKCRYDHQTHPNRWHPGRQSQLSQPLAHTRCDQSCPLPPLADTYCPIPHISYSKTKTARKQRLQFADTSRLHNRRDRQCPKAAEAHSFRASARQQSDSLRLSRFPWSIAESRE